MKTINFLVLALILIFGNELEICSLVEATPLDDYVKAPDSHYNWTLLKTYQMNEYNLYILNLTSQKWLDETVTNNPIWWHYLTISVPNNVTRQDSALVFIDGGRNDNGLPTPTDNFVELTSSFAVSTGAIGSVLKQIPNQPTVFLKDPTQKKRTEDAVIAWTWKTFFENPEDPTILLRLPMTKAVVRAMDAVTEFAGQKNYKVEKFMIAGASKRGWTTWTTAAVDERVFAAIPIVMDFLNMNRNLHVHFQSLGGYTFAFKDYYELNITTYIDTYPMFAMQLVVDPYTYLDRFRRKNILAITTGGDEFFLAEDTHSFWTDLLAATDGSALLRRLPNAEHSCAGHEISMFFTMRSFFLSSYENKPLPRLTSGRNNNATHGIIRAVVDKIKGPKPIDVKVYFAQTLSNKRKDFRLVIGTPGNPSKPMPNPVIWQATNSTLVTNETDTKLTYEIAFLRPINGWFGFFIHFTFPGPENTNIEVTTETNVIPETYPFEDCTRESCLGSLV